MLRNVEGQHDKQKSNNYKQWSSRLQTIFDAQLKRKEAYLNIRYIDKNGKVLVAVRRDANTEATNLDSYMENSVYHEHVRDTLKLPNGSVYLSEINLNREHGEVKTPFQEVLRTATPVYDERTNEAAAVIEVTVEIGHKLRKIQHNTQAFDGSKIYITNDRGGYLLHPDTNKTYGFDLGKRYRIHEDFPHLAKLYLPGNQTTQLVLLPENTDGKLVANFTKITYDPSQPERFIAVIISNSYDSIVAAETVVLDDLVIWTVILAVLATLFSVLFALRLTEPIKIVTQAVDDVAHKRKLSTKLPVDHDDEIGALARTFAYMITQVEEAEAKLKQMNHNLEKIVTERTYSLQESEIRQRTIVENMVDGLVIINETGIIQDFNPSAESIFGYRAKEVIGNNVNMLMPEPYCSEHDKYLKTFLNTGNANILGSIKELEARRKDGSVFPLDIAISEIILSNKRVFSGIVRDITERKFIEKMKNEFISTVSHELRTPLTSIRGSLGLINGGAVGDIPKPAKDMLKIADNNTERLLLLINDILDIQQIESGQLIFDYRNLEIGSFVKIAIQDNASYAELYGIKFEVTQNDFDASVYTDKNRLMQVMSNLLSNAAKFSPENGTVEIEVARQHDNFIRVSVTDQGPGIPESFQPKLFDKFTQCDSSDTRQKGGTGLGLSIAKTIVEYLGGRINFTSENGAGTTFYFELPLN